MQIISLLTSLSLEIDAWALWKEFAWSPFCPIVSGESFSHKHAFDLALHHAIFTQSSPEYSLIFAFWSVLSLPCLGIWFWLISKLGRVQAFLRILSLFVLHLTSGWASSTCQAKRVFSSSVSSKCFALNYVSVFLIDPGDELAGQKWGVIKKPRRKKRRRMRSKTL